MDPCTHKPVSYSDDKLTVLGTAKLPVECKANVEKELTFHIVVMMTNAEEEQAKLDADVKSDKSPQQLQGEVMQK